MCLAMPISDRGRLFCVLAVLFMVAAGGAAHAEPLEVEDAVRQALAANPGVARFRAQADVRAALPPQAGALPNPWISIEPGRSSMNQLRLGITQDLPYPGKRHLQQEAAQYEASAALLETGEAELQLTAQVKQAWWQLFYLDRALETVRPTQELMRQLVKVAETRYRVGAGSQQDLLRAQLGVSRLLAAEVDLVGQRRIAEVGLNSLLFRSVATPVILPAKVSEILPTVFSEETLVQRATARPMLVARQRQIDAAKTQLALAYKDYRPDFSVGAAYELREGEKDLSTVMLAMSLPLYTGSRQDRAVDQRNAELQDRRYSLDETQAQVAGEVAAAYADYRRAQHQAELLKKGIIPQAIQTVASMLAGYQVGKVDFFNLSDAQITLFDYESSYWRVFSEAHSALAQLEAAVGREAVYE